MNFRGYPAILALLLLALLVVQPVLSGENMTGVIGQIAGQNKTVVVNQTEDLAKDQGSQYYNYGVQSVNIGKYDDAIAYFNQALGQNLTMLKKTDALLYLYQGKTFAQIKLQKYSDAAATADEGLSYYPKDAMLWNNRGWALQNLNRNEEALTDYARAVSFDGNYTNALINQGNLLNGMGRYTEAAAVFTRANESDPFNVAASDGLDAARKGETESGRNTMIVLAVALIAAAGIVVWYVRFRKPAEPATDEKKKSKKNT